VREAVADWVCLNTFYFVVFADWRGVHQIAGKDILPTMDEPHGSGKQPIRSPWEISGNEIRVTLIHEGHATVWDLSIGTTTRTLYCLTYRATKARYSRFTIRTAGSKVAIVDSANLSLGFTDLSHGGVVEISFTFPHRRRLSEVKVRHSEYFEQTILLSPDAPILALLGYLDQVEFGGMSNVQLWYVL